MTVQKLNLDARLGLDKYEIDEGNSHITVDQALCQTCQPKPCLTVCPAEVYKLVDSQIAVRYENCLECGTCTIACETGGKGSIDWQPPQGGFGIIFRYG
ncbi:MAG: 4Fe-4S dicluster domain-containing protein [Chloroflexi bacterium]|nr:4Fe-4S dicluster domain-containing protein [Chloroflexota bacterium]